MRAKFVPFPHAATRARFWKKVIAKFITLEMMEKALADVRRERYNPNARRYGLYGHTGRVRRPDGHHRGGEKLERSHKARVCGSKLAHAYMLTAFELEGLDTHRSLDKDGAWLAAPAALARGATAPRRACLRFLC